VIRCLKALAAFVLVSATLLAAIVVGFTSWVDHQPHGPSQPVDAVVVFTGEPARIEAGLQRLASGQGRRLLISGTELSAGTDTEAMMAHVRQAHPEWMACCVDLDPRAQSTVENARDAAQWVRQHAFTSVGLVTSEYHMPRARLELGCAVPEIRIVAFPLATTPSTLIARLRSPAVLRRLVLEAAKFASVWFRIQITGCI
jgi:uncharacterized SAM-binding protein YcdF (DUF218 family)